MKNIMETDGQGNMPEMTIPELINKLVECLQEGYTTVKLDKEQINYDLDTEDGQFDPVNEPILIVDI